MTANPHNDQLAAAVRDDFRELVDSARLTLKDAVQEGLGEVDALAVIASTLCDDEVRMPRDRLAALLAAALVSEAARQQPVDAAFRRYEGGLGPYPAQYEKPHVYARDVHSGAGNCVCGRALRQKIHTEAANGVPVPGREV